MNYLRYTGVFLAVAIGAGILVSVLNATMDSVLGSSAQLMVPAMIAALVEGQHHAKRCKARPVVGEAWNFTWIATAIAIGLNVALAYLAAPLLPVFGRLAIAPFPSQQFIVLLGLYGAGYLICNRLFLGIGAGNQLSLMRSRGEVE